MKFLFIQELLIIIAIIVLYNVHNLKLAYAFSVECDFCDLLSGNEDAVKKLLKLKYL